MRIAASSTSRSRCCVASRSRLPLPGSKGILGAARQILRSLTKALADIKPRIGYRTLSALGLALTLAASCFVHYWRLSETPRWYGDECEQALWARKISNGDWTLGGRPRTCFSTGFSYAFSLLCNAGFAVFGKRLLAVRFVTASSAVVCTALVYLTIRELGFPYGAILGAMAWNTHTLSVNFTRWGFPHSVAGCLVVCSLLFFIRAERLGQRRNLYWSAIAAGAAVTMTYWTLLLPPVMGAAFIFRHRLRGLPAAALIAVPLASLTLLGIAIWGWNSLFTDVTSLLTNVGIGAEPQAGQTFGRTLNRVASSYSRILTLDWYIGLGALGLVSLKQNWQKAFAILLLSSLSIIPIVREGEILHTFFYRAMAFCPLLFVGFGVLWGRLGAVLNAVLSRASVTIARLVRAALLLGVAAWLCWAYAGQIKRIAAGIATPIDAYCADSAADTRAAAAFISKQLKRSSFAIASPMVAQAIEGEAEAARYVGAFFSDTPEARSRYVHNLSLERAQFLIVDRLFSIHTLVYDRGCLEFAWAIQRQKWPLVWRRNEYRIYENPKMSHGADPPAEHYRIGNPHLYKLLASREVQKGRRDVAISCLSEGLAYSPHDVQAMNMLAVAYAQKAQFRKAAAWLDRAASIAPKDVATQRNKRAVMHAWHAHSTRNRK